MSWGRKNYFKQAEHGQFYQSSDVHFVGACLSYEPIEGSNSILDDFNTTTCKHLKGGPRGSIEIFKVKVDSYCIPDAHLHVRI